MPLPSLPAFGIVDNPLIYTPFATNNSPGTAFSSHAFLLMDGTNFILMNGTDFLLMG